MASLPACASYAPDPLQPEEELAQLAAVTLDGIRFEQAGPGEAPPVEAESIDLTDGLSESELVAVALTLNPGLKAKRLEIGAAEALLITAGVWPNPEIGVGWRPGLGIAPGYALDAEFLFELLAPGERQARVDVAMAEIDSARADVVAAEWRLVSQTRRQWLAVVAAEKMAELLGQEAALRDQVVAHLKRRRELGEGTELEVATAELERAQAQRDLRLAGAEVEALRRRLNGILGLPPHHQLSLTDSEKPLTITLFDELSEEELDRRLLAGRFELRALESSYQQAEHELRLAIAQQYPRLRIGPSFGHEPDGTDYLGLGIALPIPLFDRNQGEIAEKLSLRARRRAEYVATLHSLRSAAHDSQARLQRAKSEVATQEGELLPVLTRTTSLFERAFSARDISILEWVTARQRALTARRGFLDALVRYRGALIDLESATGLPLSKPAEGRTP